MATKTQYEKLNKELLKQAKELLEKKCEYIYYDEHIIITKALHAYVKELKKYDTN